MPLRRGHKSRIILTGRHSYGIENIKLLSWDEGADLFIGGFCSIGPNQKVFLGGNHRTDWVTTYPFGHTALESFPLGCVNGSGHPATKGHVVIENDVWIGEGSTIMSGVTISSGSVVAAQSVVVKDVEPYTIVGGNPAKVIKNRFSPLHCQRLLEIKWWDRSDEDINKIVPLLQQEPTADNLVQIHQTLEAASKILIL